MSLTLGSHIEFGSNDLSLHGFQRSQPTQGGTVWQQQMPENRDQLLS